MQSCQLIVLPSQGTICIPALMLAVIRGGVRGQLRKMQGYRNKEIMDADLQSFDEGMTTLANRRSVIEASLIQLCAHYQLSTYRAGAGRVTRIQVKDQSADLSSMSGNGKLSDRLSLTCPLILLR